MRIQLQFVQSDEPQPINLLTQLQRHQQAFLADPMPSVKLRIERLLTLRSVLRANLTSLIAA